MLSRRRLCDRHLNREIGSKILGIERGDFTCFGCPRSRETVGVRRYLEGGRPVSLVDRDSWWQRNVLAVRAKVYGG